MNEFYLRNACSALNDSAKSGVDGVVSDLAFAQDNHVGRGFLFRYHARTRAQAVAHGRVMRRVHRVVAPIAMVPHVVALERLDQHFPRVRLAHLRPARPRVAFLAAQRGLMEARAARDGIRGAPGERAPISEAGDGEGVL